MDRVEVLDQIKDVEVVRPQNNLKRDAVVDRAKTLKQIKELNETLRTPLPRYAKVSVIRRFIRAFIPQIPVAVVVGIKADNFWLGFGLTLLGASGTALDKCLREKKRIHGEM